MAGKLTAVFAKKEAEAYCSQGLHQEALKLYQNLLSSSPNLGASFKDAIQEKVDAIQTELNGGAKQESHLLSAPEIRRIREGWGTNATTGDLLVCAQAFSQVGHYQEALSEVARLLQKGCHEQEALTVFAQCLVHLRTPEQLNKTIAMMGKKLFHQLERRCRFYLSLTEEMVNQEQKPHAEALYQYLLIDPIISKKAPQRLDAIKKRMDQIAAETDPASQEDESGALADTHGYEAMPDAHSDEIMTAPPEREASPPTQAGGNKLFGWLPFFRKSDSQ